MATHVTRWRPDTCGCEIEYSWDDSVPSESRVHTLVSIKKDAIHSALLPDDVAYTAVLGENTRKNRAIGAALANFPTKIGMLDSAGNTMPDDTKYSWSFDAARNVLLSIPSLTPPQRTALQAICDTAFGAGKVIVS